MLDDLDARSGVERRRRVDAQPRVAVLASFDRVRPESDLRKVVRFNADQVLIVDLGGNEEAAREAATTLGPGLPEQEGGMVVI